MMKRFSLYMVFLFVGYSSFSQNRKIDSLLSIIYTLHDTDKVKKFEGISHYYSLNDPTTALKYADSCIKYGERISDKIWLGAGFSLKGSCYTTLGKFDLALVEMHKAIKIFEAVNSKRSIINSYNSIANIYSTISRRKEAYEFYLKGYNMANADPVNEYMIAITSVGMGNMLAEDKKYDEAINYYRKSENYFKMSGNNSNEALCKIMIGQAYLSDSLLTEAEKIFIEVMPILQNNNNLYGLSANYQSLGSISRIKKDYINAAKYFKEALDINISRKAWHDIRSSALNYSETLELLNKPGDALRSYKMYMQFNDSVVSIEKNKAIAESETKYETEKKEAQLKIKNSELEKSQLQIDQRNHLIYFFIAATIIFIVLLFLVYRQVREKKKANNLLQTQNREIEKQSALIEEKNKDITDSINYSKFIQQAIIPTSKKVKQFLPESFVVFKPKDIVSGDFYLVEEVVGLVYLAVVDCTGHGVPGAMLSVFADSTIKNSISSNQFRDSPAAILSDLCFQFKSNLQTDSTANTVNDGVDMAICIIDKKAGKLRFSGARNGLLLIRNKQIIEFHASRSGISGSNKGSQLFYEDHFIDVEPGDKFYIYTDGFADQFGGEKGKKFKQKQLNALLLETNNLPMDEQKIFIENHFYTWKGSLEQIDDVTLLGFKI